MKTIKYILMMLSVVVLSSCNTFLEMKPDKSINTPTKLSDLEYLFNNTNIMNTFSVGLGEIVSDDIFYTDNNWRALSMASRNFYTFTHDFPAASQWTGGYNMVMYANTVLDYLDIVKDDRSKKNLKNELEGSAYFYRSFAFFDLLQVFSKAYQDQTAQHDLGIVLRLSSDNQMASKRYSIADCFKQILDDLLRAEVLLPTISEHPTKPSKIAVYGLLARVYLSMGEISKASSYSKKALDKYAKILDYNKISGDNPIPFEIYNEEVIYHSTMNGGDFLNPVRFRVTSDLINSYPEEDLRKDIFYVINGDGYYSFKGNYLGNVTSTLLFCGITVPELMLIKAEGLLVDNKLEEASSVINLLRKHRIDSHNFHELVIRNKEEGVTILKDERRKELAFRGLRWQDLRRFAVVSQSEFQLNRLVEGKEYVLSRNELINYAFWIPQSVIVATGIPQN